MKLLLDLGNTRLKWAIHGHEGVTGVRAVAWEALDRQGLPDDLIRAACEADRILGACVAGAARESRITEALRTHAAVAPEWVRTPAAACGVRNAYPLHGKLGVDRFLGLVAALDAGLAPCVVASAGTALALDALAADGRHLGGLIAPGPRLMQRALHQAAAQLPEPVDTPIVDVADDTESAIASGCWHAALGLLERFHARMAGRLDGAGTVVVLSGGDAQALAAELAVPVRVHPDLVLEGLAVWGAADAAGA